MTNVPHYKPCVVTPLYIDGLPNVLVQDGNTNLKARLNTEITFETNLSCLAVVDCEVLNEQVVITDLNLIVININAAKMLNIFSMSNDLLRDGFIDIVNLIINIQDKHLQSFVFDSILDHLLTFNKLGTVELQLFHQSILTNARFLWQQNNSIYISKYDSDVLLAKSILSELGG